MDPNKKTIIFDFGNVLINLDFDDCFQNFERILNVDWSERRLPQFLKDSIYQYDKGLINDDQFVQSFLKLNGSSNYNEIVEAWNSLLRDIPSERFNFLEKLSGKFNLILLSNINNLHLDCVHNYLVNEFDISDFEERYFDKVFYSHIIGKRKPDNEIYQFVTNALNIAPQDILFIDDLKENVKAAQQNLWNAVVHRPTDDIVTMMPIYLKTVDF